MDPSGPCPVNSRHVCLRTCGSDEAEAKDCGIAAELVASARATTPTVDPKSAGQLTINQLVLADWKVARRYYRKNARPTSELGTLKTP